jgi:hypothetical protein
MISSEQINKVRALANTKYPDCNSLTLNKLGCPESSCSQHTTYAATILNKQGEVIELAFSDQSEEDAITNLTAKLNRK